jgi:glutamate N-acetyltransferase/amino-acid N-acetyltransferase
VLLLASGATGGDAVTPGTKDAGLLADAVQEVCEDLARQTVARAEGATKMLVVQVDRAADRDAARRIGLAIAGSALVKTAVFGGDPNPGRLLQAMGDAGVPLDPGEVSASFGDVKVIDHGLVLEPAEAKRALEGPEVVVRVELGGGSESATVFGCDLGYEYIDVNARYTT